MVVARLVISLVVSVMLFSWVSGSLLVAAVGQPDPTWVNPSAMSLKLIGSAEATAGQPNFESNLDCLELTYRPNGSLTTQSGCFVTTAFGLVDPDSETVIFNGSDEGLELIPHGPHDILTPWPKTADVLDLNATNFGGTYVGLYKDLSAKLQNQRNSLAELTGKQVTAAADLQFSDPSGQPLAINPQTIAFSDNASWMVVETLSGSFIRMNLATQEMVPFAPEITVNGNPALLKSQVSVSDSGRFVAIQNAVAGTFKVYDLSSCSGTSTDLQPLNCKSFDYQPYINSQVAGQQGITHVRFLNDGLLTFRATTTLGTDEYELAPAASINNLIDYLGLGDSYTSGEGAFDYLSGTDTSENMCHLSVHSYPLLLTDDLFQNGGHSVACSGAVIGDITPDNDAVYKGQVADGITLSNRGSDAIAQLIASYSPGYLPQADFLRYYQPGILTVSVGGDDIGFGDIVQTCVEPHLGLSTGSNTCFNTYEDRLELKNLIDSTVPRWVTLYKTLQQDSPTSHIYAIGYPQVADPDGNCALNVHLNREELLFTQQLVDYLNSAIATAAQTAGVQYVDISQSLVGHRLCEASGYDIAVNGLTAGTDDGVFGVNVLGKESYHPNALGQALMEQAILEQTRNFTSKTTVSDQEDGSALLSSPKTGRPIYTLEPDDILTSKVVGRNQSITVTVTGADYGLNPDTNYTVSLDGGGGSSIGVVTSNDGGDVSGQVIIPPTTNNGEHTIDLIGTDQSGEPVDVRQPIYVASTPTDTDGDGIDDANDSCPGAINSNVDADHDGIDDACDPIIGSPTSNSDGGSTSDSSSTSSMAEPMPTALGTQKASLHPKPRPQHTLSGATQAQQSSPSKNSAEITAPYTNAPTTVISWWAWLRLTITLWLVLVIVIYTIYRLRQQRQTYTFWGWEHGFG